MSARGPSRADVAAAMAARIPAQDRERAVETLKERVNDFFRKRGEARTYDGDFLRLLLEALIETRYTHIKRGAFERKSVLFELPRTWVHDRPMVGASSSTQIAHSALFGSVTAALSRAVGGEGGRLEIVTNMSDLTWPGGLPEGEEWIELRRRYSANTAAEQLRRAIEQRPKSISGIVIIDPGQDDPRLAWLRASGVPYVVMGRAPKADYDGHVVDIDDHAGFEAVARHLVSLGIDPDRVGHVRFMDDRTGPPARRRAGVLSGLGVPPTGRRPSKAGVVPSDEIVGRNSHEIAYHDSDQPSIVAGLAVWLEKHRWQAVIADCDRFAAYVVKAAGVKGIRVSSDPENGVVVTGCDDSIERHASASSWITLRQPVHEWADAVVNSLKAQQRGRVGSAPILVHPVLIDPEDRPLPGQDLANGQL